MTRAATLALLLAAAYFTALEVLRSEAAPAACLAFLLGIGAREVARWRRKPERKPAPVTSLQLVRLERRARRGRTGAV